jgi:hypothetical protein
MIHRPLAQHISPWFTTTGSVYLTIISNHFLWIMVSYAEPVVVYHCDLCWASGCESWMLRKHFPISVNFLLQSNTLWIKTMDNINLRSGTDKYPENIIVIYAEPVVVSHGVLCWANDCDSWCAMLNQWLWFMLCYAELVVVNHGSQPLAQHKSQWYTTTGSA